RSALEEASAKLPGDAYTWNNLGLAYKDAGDTAKAIEAFQHVERAAPEEPDAFYFDGYLYSQLQQYDHSIQALQKALHPSPSHASVRIGLARVYPRQGDIGGSREGMKRFQKGTSEHLGNPCGAGYGDQGKFTLAVFVPGSGASVPMAIPVRYEVQPLSKLV